MIIPARFTNARRALQLGWYGLRHGARVFEKLNRTNLFLAKQFSTVKIRCNVCGDMAQVWYEMHSIKRSMEHKVGLLRETLECLNCLSRIRYRIMAEGLLRESRETFGIDKRSIKDLALELKGIDVLDTDAFSPAARILAASPGYKLSSYIPEQPFGLMPDKKIYNIDLQAMTFADNTFDIILSSDVMEHVRDTASAYREIYRCLKPGGAHIFTIPFDENALTTKTLIDASSPRDIYLELPQIHGDDHLTGGIPAYRIYGVDLLDSLRAHGFEATYVRVNSAESGIYNGLYFVARRPLSGSRGSAKTAASCRLDIGDLEMCDHRHSYTRPTDSVSVAPLSVGG
jgi:SAM-dependent methyltransferase